MNKERDYVYDQYQKHYSGRNLSKRKKSGVFKKLWKEAKRRYK